MDVNTEHSPLDYASGKLHIQSQGKKAVPVVESI